MATMPQSKPRKGFTRPSWPVIIAAVLVIAVVISLIARFTVGQSTATTITGTPAAVTRGSLASTISATGNVEPLLESNLAFVAREGRITEVLVQVGDEVALNAPLVRLETRQLEAEVTAAQAVLDQARADLQDLKDGATAEQIAAAEAQVAAAQGSLRETQGSVAAPDVRAAQLAVAEARARLALVTGNPDANEVEFLRAALAQAQINLETDRTTLANTKVEAERVIEARANELREAQTAYDQAKRERERAENGDNDPVTNAPMTDSQRERYVNAAITAERTMIDAERALEQAQVDYDTIKQNEVQGIANGEAQVRRAQADLNAVLNPGADTVASARAELAKAEADLAKLNGEERAGAIASQQGNVSAAQAELNELLADPSASDLARATALVNQREAQLQQAKIRLEEATLLAPFAGVVADVGVGVGEQIGTDAPIRLIDVSRYIIEVTVDEIDVARVQVGQTVEVLIDALGSPALIGTVKRIAPQAQATSEVTAYELTLEVDPGQRPVRAGMTASANIVLDRRDNVLLVPASAVRTENGQTVVTVVTTDANGQQQTSTQAVEVGLRANDQIEIRSGLTEGQQVLLPR
jgi:RND family efflux transporter MFP subunit